MSLCNGEEPLPISPKFTLDTTKCTQVFKIENMKCTQVFTTFPEYLKRFWQAQAASDWTGRIVHSYFQISPKTFGGVQVWALAELLKDIQSGPEATAFLSWISA